VLLTAYKTLSYRNEMNRTVTVLARDSIIYFIIIAGFLALLVAYDVDSNFKLAVKVSAECAASIAVRRMTMNLRGLIMEDPTYTVHLRTLKFNTRITSVEEIEGE